MQIQQKQGLFPRIIGKGNNAKRLADLLLRMRSEIGAGDEGSNGSSLNLTPSQYVESLIIIDREADFPTPLLTQLTYEGLIDEEFCISSNQIELDSSIVGAPPPQASQGSSSSTAQSSLKRKVILDGADPLYTTLRDVNCAVVGPTLNKVARRLQSTYDSRNTAGKTTAELREFVAKLPGYQAEQASLKLHTNLAEEIIKRTRSEIFTRLLEVQQNIAAGADPSTQHDNIEELIARAVPLQKVLRLICLESAMSNGLRPKDLENFKRAIIQGYGHQHLLTLSGLEKMGLLELRQGGLVGGGPPTGKSTNYSSVRKNLHLIFDEVNEAEPDDIAYVFSGYAPLSVRLVQCILQKQYLASLTASRGAATAASSATQGWRPFEDTVKQVRGTTFDEAQTGEEKAVRARQMLNGSGHADGGKTVIVFYLGGICRAEIAALRFLAQQLKEEGRGRRLLICTTSVISGDAMVEAAVEHRTFAD
jgi:vacuolar protein sorting-associated protein 33A